MFRWWEIFANRIINWRALDDYRRLLVSREVGYRWLVDSSSCVYVNCIDDFVHRLRSFVRPSVLRLILSGRSKEETPVRGEGESAEERFQRVVGIDVGILNP